MAVGTLYLFGGYASDPNPVKAWTISHASRSLSVVQRLELPIERLSIFQMNPFSNLFLIGATVI